ncbi:MAG: CHAD domain-containing protein [Chitinophagales bacterium]|nr:CHAD domain-containing protein [Chitinophagales bacterium]
MHLYFTSGKRLDKDVSKKLSALKRHAGLAAATHDEEEIHKFRVKYKKLRALLRMEASAGYKRTIPKQLKQLYTAAGAVRDLQLHHKTVSAYFLQYNTLPAHYLQHIQDEIKEAIIIYNNIYKQVSFSRIYKLSFVDMPGKLKREELIVWHRQHITAVKNISTRTITDEAIHAIRKLLKDLVYTSSYISSGNDHAALALLLGDYMDSCVLLTFLNRYEHYAPPDEKVMLEHVMQSLEAGKEEQRKKLLQVITDYN